MCFYLDTELMNVFSQEPLEQCPYDHNHRVPPRSLEKHKLSCRLRKMGYSPEEQVTCMELEWILK